ncbi:DNA polymerase III subunit tau [termite gut metagenome]|uniref:DNA-directed DNA polymerase n=1 Tax=termite gut metagenome TaxID=433724 RepID=A0A5J4SDT8_9ZZZZ
MENYIVSARKYRPSTFESVVGQKALTTTLKNAISTQKLAHAYLFCGPRGVGKTTCARIFAKTINCMNLTTEGEACNTCESCVSFNEQRSYNIHELDAASNNSVDDIRQLVEQVRIPPQVGKYKVYIIDEVHMLSTSAFNAFLKTLEEPPKHAVFILATTEKQKILPTILSRCQIYDFNRITIDDMVHHLMYVASKENITVEPDALNVIALKADGGMRDALSIFDQIVNFTGGNITYQGVIENLNVLDYEYYFRLTDYLLENNVSEALLLFNDVLNNGFDGGHFITGLSSHFRDVLVSKEPATLQLLEVGANIRERYRIQAQQCPLPFLYCAMKLSNDCDINYRIAKNKRLLIELTLIQIAQITVSEDKDTSSGHSPKQEIKPIFTQPAANQSAISNPIPDTTTPVTATTASILQSKAVEEKKIPSMKGAEMGFSIKNTQGKVIQKTSVSNNEQSQLTSVSKENHPFDENRLNYYWQEYAKQMSLERKAIAMRMQNIRVTLLNETSFEVVVDNEIAAKDFTTLIPELQSYLRDCLKNQEIKMTIRVSEPMENVRAISRTEKFQSMAQKNKMLLLLKDEFGLEFS